jgi:hypothetical protein
MYGYFVNWNYLLTIYARNEVFLTALNVGFDRLILHLSLTQLALKYH